jgi:NAD-dependent dihydropyrimidine dehydrogenase PreA subunit
MKEDDVYRKLAERWGHPDSARFLQILKMIMTPEEGELLYEIPTPTASEDLATRLNMSKESVEEKLHELARRGLVLIGKRGYSTPVSGGNLHDSTLSSAEEYIPPGVLDLWKDFYYAEHRQDVIDSLTRRWRTGEGLPAMRVFPSWKALEASPRIPKEEIMPCEDIREIIKAADPVSVVACPCRRVLGDYERPLEVCLQVNRAAQYAINRGAAKRALSKEEAIELMGEAEEAGLVHTVSNSVVTTRLVCNCCACCCPLIEPLHYHKIKHRDAMSPSRYEATVEAELCTGCQDCVEVCPFDAIDMKKSTDSKKLKAVVDPERCMGCGVCVLRCSPHALTLELVRPKEHIPEARATALPT